MRLKTVSNNKLDILEQTRNARLAQIHASKKENVIGRRTRAVSGSIGSLSAELDEKKKKLTEVGKLAEHQAQVNETLQTTIHILEESKHSLSSHLEEMQHILGDASKRLNKAHERASETSQRLRDSRKAIRRLQESQTLLRQENDQFQKDIEEKERRLIEFQANNHLLQQEVAAHLQSLQISGAMLHTSQFKCFTSANHLQSLQKDLKASQIGNYNYKVKINDLRNHNAHMRKACSALRIRLSHCRKQASLIKFSALKTIQLTVRGVYTPRIRCLVRRIACLGVSLSSCGLVIGEFLRFLCIFLGVRESDEKIKIRIPSPRTVRRIVGEGGVASKLQLAVGLKEADGECSSLFQRRKKGSV